MRPLQEPTEDHRSESWYGGGHDVHVDVDSASTCGPDGPIPGRFLQPFPGELMMSDNLPQPSRLLPSRRDFIKTSAVVAAGTSLLGNLSIARAAHAFGDDTIKIGLIGCGGRGTGAAKQALSTEGKVKLVAVGDAFADRIEGSLKGLQKEVGDRVDVPQERQFVGFDAYQKVLDAGR